MDETFESLSSEAAGLRRAGRVAEGIAAYKRLLARWPETPNSWYNLGLLQRRAGLFDEALASYQQALARGIDQPEEVHLNRGVIFADFLQRADEAERELKTALRLNPNYVPALMNLANLCEDGGEREEAAALYERILSIAPDYHEALARLSGTRASVTADDPVAGRIRTALADSRLAPQDRASLSFALGRLLDRCGAYDNAFAAYTVANQASRQSVTPPVVYDRHAHERLIDDIIATFTADRFRAAERGKPSPSLFICGMFRSGSTLVEHALGRHPRVTAGGELDILTDLAGRELLPYPASVAQLTPEKARDIADRYRGEIAKRFPNAEIVTDKRPDNFVHIGLIKLLFPDAKIVHTVRNALDNCLSVFFLHLDQRMSYALDLSDIGHYFGQYRRLMAHWKALFGPDIFDFDYDAFVHAPKAELEKLLAFCGLEWNDSCLEPHLARGAIRTASVWQVREPLYLRSSGRWRNYERHIEQLVTSLPR